MKVVCVLYVFCIKKRAFLTTCPGQRDALLSVSMYLHSVYFLCYTCRFSYIFVVVLWNSFCDNTCLGQTCVFLQCVYCW